MIKVGINGFGRIGRFVFRAAMKRNDIQIVGINDLCPVDYLAYMLKYDTMHGQFDGTIEADVENSKLIVNGQSIRITAERNPADLKWVMKAAEIGADGKEIAPAVSLDYGQFLQATFDFLIIAFSIFLFIRLITKLTTKKNEEAPAAPPAPPAPTKEEVLLTEIRDLLKEKN